MKLTSKQIKEEITGFVKNNIDYFLGCFDKNDPNIDKIEKALLKPWVRESKTRVSNSEFTSVEDLEEFVNGGLTDGVGIIDVPKLKSVNKGSCWFRVFVEPEGDNFRCEVVTDPKDEEILAMDFVVD